MKLFSLAVLISLPLIVVAKPQGGARIDRIWAAAEQRFVMQSNSWWNDGDFLRCIQLLRFQAELKPDDYEVVSDLGWMLGNVEAYDEELATYLKYKSNKDAGLDANYPLASYYFTKKLYAYVPPLVEPMMKKKLEPNYYRMLANSYEKMGFLSDSERVWKVYLAQGVEDGQAKANLSRVQSKKAGTYKGTPTKEDPTVPNQRPKSRK